MHEPDHLEIDAAPPRWMRLTIWLSLPVAALAFGMAVVSILDIRGRGANLSSADLHVAAPSKAAPVHAAAVFTSGPPTEEDARLARLRADRAAEEAHVAALADVARALAAERDEDLNHAAAQGTAAAATSAVTGPEMTGPPFELRPPVRIAAFAQLASSHAPGLPTPVSAPFLRFAGDLAPPLIPPVLVAAPPANASPALRLETSLPPSPALAPRGWTDTPGVSARLRSGGARSVAAARAPARAEARRPAADPRCGALLARLQLGERPTPGERNVLQLACGSRL